MVAMRRYWYVLLAASVLLAVAVGMTGCPSACVQKCPPFDCRTDAVHSPNGSVPTGAQAISPDGQYYAQEVAPFGNGHVGVFAAGTGALVQQIDLPTGANDLKGLAWAATNPWLAMMYHASGVSQIYVYDVQTGFPVTTVWTPGFHHLMVFSGNGQLVLATGCNGILQTVDVLSDFKRNSGANLPWIHYGWDFGAHPWGGAHGGFSSNLAELDEVMAFLAMHGVKVVRVFLLCDMRTGLAAPKSPGRAALAFDSYVYPDMDALVASAQTHGLLLMPVLLDYTIADGVSEEKATAVGERPDLLTTQRADFVALLGQLVARYANHPAIYAWDVMNEPDLVTAVSQPDLRTFLGDLVTAVHAQTNHPVTLGSRNCQDIAQWQGLGLDLYQLHYYDAMETACPLATPATALGLDKPVILGEVQPTDVGPRLGVIEQSGYVGALYWSLNADFPLTPLVASQYAQYFGTP